MKLYGQQPAEEDGGKWGGSVLAQSAYYSERGENAHLAVPTISAASAAAAAEFPLEGRKHAQKPVVSLGQRAGEAPPPALTAFAEQRAGASDAYTFAPSPAAPPPPPPQHHVDTLKAAFGEFDRNGDGVLSMLEVTAALKRLQLSPPMSLLRQFAKADGNADGSLQFAEFCALVAELQRQSGVGAAGSGGASSAAGRRRRRRRRRRRSCWKRRGSLRCTTGTSRGTSTRGSSSAR